jgi:hypothetical protein
MVAGGGDVGIALGWRYRLPIGPLAPADDLLVDAQRTTVSIPKADLCVLALGGILQVGEDIGPAQDALVILQPTDCGVPTGYGSEVS